MVKYFRFDIFLFIITFLNGPEQGVNASPLSVLNLNTDSLLSFRSPEGYVPSLLHNFGEQAAAPFKFDGRKWAIAGATAGITVMLITLDNNIDEWALPLKDDHRLIRETSPVITQLGGPAGVYSVLGLGLINAAAGKKRGVESCLLATQAMITSGIWAQVLKQLTGRERPKASYIFSGLDGGKWHGPFEKYSDEIVDDRSKFSYDAFPSGHTATAFSIATVFASRYNRTWVIPVISYSAASLVGISRLTEHEHWASDVFLGAVLGYVCGKQVVANYNNRHQGTNPGFSQRPGNHSQLTFFSYGNQVGLSVVW